MLNLRCKAAEHAWGVQGQSYSLGARLPYTGCLHKTLLTHDLRRSCRHIFLGSHVSSIFLLHLSCEVFPGIKTLPESVLRVKSDPKRGVLTPKQCSKAAGNETLIRSPDCGSLNLTGNSDSQQSLAAFNSVNVNDTLAATTYSRACYGSSQSLLQCTQYPQQQLPWKITQNATCPFTHDICIDGVSSAYEMDSGPIDSHDALGINAPNSERVQYRKVTTCKLAFQPFMPIPYRTRVAGHVRGAD